MDNYYTTTYSESMYGSPSQSGTSDEKTINRVGADCGNRLLKFGLGVNNIEVIPSVTYIPIDIDYISPDAKETRIVNYHSGQCSDLSKKTWVVGKSARSFNGNHTFLGEKADCMHQLALACIPVVGDDLVAPVSLLLKELRLCLPDAHDKNKAKKLKQKLIGDHHLTINESELRVTIDRVKVVPEGFDAYRWLEYQGFYQFEAINGTLDIGGGNTTGQLFSDAGDPIGGSRVVAPGMVALASAIAKNPALFGTEGKGCSPKLETILDGIADSSFVYGTTGISFAEVFQKYLALWVQDIYKTVRTAWDPYLKSLGEVAIIGGGATHAEWFVDRTKGRFKIAPDSAICTVRGMLL